MQKTTESLKVESAASPMRVGEVVEEHGGVGRREIDLIHPTVFTSRLTFDQPRVMKQTAVFDERIEMEALCPSLECNRLISLGGILFL